MWVWPQVPLGGPPPPPPCALGPLPPNSLAAPSRSLAKRARGVGGRGKERAGREGVWLEGRVLQLQWGMGGPSKHQLGPDPHLGAPRSIHARLSPFPKQHPRPLSETFFRDAPDTFNFLRHVMRAIWSVRPKCSHRCVSLKENY